MTTKQQIKQTFIDLLQEKPLGQIAVRELSDLCEINRNTFYYYYRDLNALVEDIVNEETDQILAAYPSPSSIEDCSYAILDFVKANRRIAYHIYQSLSRAICEKHLWKLCRKLVTTYYSNAKNCKKLTSDDTLLIDFYTCQCFGLAMRWFEIGFDDQTARKSIRRLYQLFGHSAPSAHFQNPENQL